MKASSKNVKKSSSVNVINAVNQSKYISRNDAEMDKRAKCAVKAAIAKAEICRKPVAYYDAENKKVYLKYANGKKKYL